LGAGPHGRTAALPLGPSELSGSSRVRSVATSLESQSQAAGLASCGAIKARSFSVRPRLDVAMDLVEPVEVDEALQRPRHNRADLLLGEAAAGGLRRRRADSVGGRDGNLAAPGTAAGLGLGCEGGDPMETRAGAPP
jgi:hypothetical protein